MSNYPDDELGGRLGGLTVEDEGEGVTNMTQITENDGWNGANEHDAKEDDDNKPPTVDLPPESYDVEQEVLIKNFSRIASQSNAQYSEPIKCGGLDWRLMIFPRGLPRRPYYLAVFVEAMDWRKFPSGTMHVECTLSLVNHRDAALSTRNHFTQVLHSQCTDQGFDSLLSLQSLTEQAGFIKDDTLTFRIKIMLPNPNKSFGSRRDWDSRKETGFIGLVNQGATCYMSSLLQNLFHNSHLRRAVYQMPIVDAAQRTRSIPWQMQRLFYELQTAPKAVETKGLTRSFGWTEKDAYQQHDIQEFARVLQDKLEEKMKGTPLDGTMNRLFVGQQQSYCQCINVDYVSKRTEDFYDLSMNVKGFPTLLKSFENYIDVEELKGSNQYRAEQHGLQDAKKGVRFLKFPPVLQLQLKRFEYDPYQDQMVKINDRFEFQPELDLSEFVPNIPEADHSTPPIYILQSVLVHVGGIHGGHYYAFVRPSATDSKWYKFDDEKVTQVEEREAVQDNWGGPSVSPYGVSGLQKLNSAYMLTYVRKSDAAEILRPIANDEVPAAVVDGIKEEDQLRVQEEANRRRLMMMTKVNVLFERDLLACNVNMSEMVGSKVGSRQFQIEKFKTLADLSVLIEQETGIPVAKQAFFRIVARDNKCIRPNSTVSVDDFQGRYFGPIDYVVQQHTNLPSISPVWPNDLHGFYLAELPDTISPAAQAVGCVTAGSYPSVINEVCSKTPTKVMLTFKYFDIRLQTLRIVGSRVVDLATTFQQLAPLLIEMCQGQLAPNAPLRFFEENRAPSSLPEYSGEDQLLASKIISGDIICFCEQLQPLELKAIHDNWQAKQQAVVEDNRRAKAAQRAAQRAVDDQKRLTELSMTADERKAAAAQAGAAAKTEAETDSGVPQRVTVRPLFCPAPDILLRTMFNVVSVKMEQRESSPVVSFQMELYRDRPVVEAVQALADHYGVPIDYVRMFQMNFQRQYMLDSSVTYSSVGPLSNFTPNVAMFVFEVLDHSVDLLKTHMQANVTWCDAKLGLTLLRPMCPKEGTLQDAFLAVREMLAAQGINVPASANYRVMDVIDGNIVKHVLPHDTSCAKVWDWIHGFSNPRKYIRMELVPADEVESSKIVWCHSFNAHQHVFGVPFAASLLPNETAAEFKIRIGARLGESAEAVKRSWKLFQCGAVRNEPIADDVVLSTIEFGPYVQRFGRSDLTPSTLPALGIQRPNNSQRAAAPVDNSIRITEVTE